jgi:hypothetical protein
VSSHHRLLNTRTLTDAAGQGRICVAWVVKKGAKRRREEGEMTRKDEHKQTLDGCTTRQYETLRCSNIHTPLSGQ